MEGFNDSEAVYVATLIVALEELEDKDTHKIVETPIEQMKSFSDQMALGEFKRACRKYALELCDSRVNESTQIYLAILIYLISLATTFVDDLEDIDSSSTPPGNRIAYVVMFIWLIPTVLLSAFMGRFLSKRSCQRVVNRFQERFRGVNSYLNAHPWNGTIYSYRPQKQIFASSKNRRSQNGNSPQTDRAWWWLFS